MTSGARREGRWRISWRERPDRSGVERSIASYAERLGFEERRRDDEAIETVVGRADPSGELILCPQEREKTGNRWSSLPLSVHELAGERLCGRIVEQSRLDIERILSLSLALSLALSLSLSLSLPALAPGSRSRLSLPLPLSLALSRALSRSLARARDVATLEAARDELESRGVAGRTARGATCLILVRGPDENERAAESRTGRQGRTVCSSHVPGTRSSRRRRSARTPW